jgi:hypothetical protein
MLHPDAPESVTKDPDLYAAWRRDHLDHDHAASLRGLTDEEVLALYRDEWHDSPETPENLANADAAFELHVENESKGMASLAIERARDPERLVFV